MNYHLIKNIVSLLSAWEHGADAQDHANEISAIYQALNEHKNDVVTDLEMIAPYIDRIAELDKGCAGLTIEEQEQNMLNSKAKWYQEGVESEREACAKLLEEGAGLPDLSAHSKFEMYLKIYMQRVADQIRERSA